LGEVNCKICNTIVDLAFSPKVLNKYDVKYFKCKKCGVLFTEDSYWMAEAYARPINISDTGLVNRNIYFSKILSVFIYFNFNRNGKYLDYAGGYGLFTRLMRDIGFDFYWHDPYSPNILASGFERKTESKFDLITAFEVFEHLANPIKDIAKMLQITDSIAFSTELIPEEIPDPKEWWYYGFNHGQHLIFYSERTLVRIAKHFNLNYYKLSGIHILTKRRISSFRLFLNRFYNLGLSQLVKINMVSKIQSDFESIKSE
jgi:hypothetical protein